MEKGHDGRNVDNKTWVFINLPLGMGPISYEWVRKVKNQSHGTIKCFKAHLIIHSDGQALG